MREEAYKRSAEQFGVGHHHLEKEMEEAGQHHKVTETKADAGQEGSIKIAPSGDDEEGDLKGAYVSFQGVRALRGGILVSNLQVKLSCVL